MMMMMTTTTTTMIMKDIYCTFNRQFFQDLGQLESTVPGTRYISNRPRHRKTCITQLNFKARNNNNTAACMPTELASFLQDDIHYIYVTSAELKTNM
jgi:hypothetical protein